jgi:energy-coupling factor transporter ATP-binding protein EcfA2
MQRITEIRLRNYRAFGDQEEARIKLHRGENLLIYGENGSGKTSLFNALSDFLEASAQKNHSFTANRYATKVQGSTEDETPGHVRVCFSPGEVQGATSEIYQFGPAPLEGIVQPVYDISYLRKANQTRAFLSYQEIVRTYLAADKEAASDQAAQASKAKRLFNLLVEVLLSHHKLPISGRLVGEELPELRAYNSRRKDSWQYGEATERLDDPRAATSFEQDLYALLNPVFGELNDYLADYFDKNLRLEFEVFVRRKASGRDLQTELRLRLRFGGHEPAADYAGFLNEARLSALAVCFYLAAIRTNPQPDYYRILFLDDVFIGLDTNNRLPLLQLLKAKFVEPTEKEETYQVFLTTYDREWFDLASRELGKKGWQHLEMYAEEVVTNVALAGPPPTLEERRHYVPALVVTEDYFSSAQSFRRCHNYPQAGNALRKELERLMKELLPNELRIDFDTGRIRKLEDQLNAFEKLYSKYGLLHSTLLQRLKLFRDLVLNPASHHDLRRFLYRTEVDKTFDVVEELRKLDMVAEKVALQTGSLLYYRNGGYEAKLRLTENLLVGKVESKPLVISDANHRILFWRLNSVDYAGPNGQAIHLKQIEKHTSETKTCSFRAGQIEQFLALKKGVINWQVDFLTSDGRSLIDCSNELDW